MVTVHVLPRLWFTFFPRVPSAALCPVKPSLSSSHPDTFFLVFSDHSIRLAARSCRHGGREYLCLRG